MWSDNPNWLMTVLFLLALALLCFVMKLIVILLPVTPQAVGPFVSWLLVSPETFVRSQSVASIQRVLLQALMLLGAACLSFWIYWWLVSAFQIRGILLSYLAVPILLLLMEFLVTTLRLILLPGGRLLPALHRRPWAARSIAEFWGKRWNLWFSDWFRYVVFRPLRRWPVFALILVFAASGLMHEWVINVPLYYLTGRVLFGSMVIYFLLQAVGILWEHYVLKGHPRLIMTFVWLVVFVPLPLVLNEGMLRVLHLWPGIKP